MKLIKFPLLLIAVFFLQSQLIAQSKPININNQRQLFVDNFLIDQLKGTRLLIGIPHDDGDVLDFDKPWEGAFCNYVTMIKDSLGLYRVYYRGSAGGKDGSNSEVTCMAVSTDGIHWTKPALKLFEKDSTLENNIILADQAPSSHNFSPFIDKNPAASKDEKWKALALGKGGLVPYASADGIRWHRMQEQPVITKGAFDSQNVPFWSESENRYVCYFRTWTRGKFKGIRSVSRVTSSDFIHWSEPVQMTFGNTPLENIYIQQTSAYFRAPQIYLAIGARFMPGREVISAEDAERLHVNPNYFKDISDVVLMSTRGGDSYNRYFMQSFIRPGIGLDNWVSRTNYPALNVVQTGQNQMSVYLVQDYAQPTAHLQRYSLRLDGFSSVHADYDGGEMITKPFVFTGKEMEINFSTSAAGEIRIAIEDANGKPVPGFGIDHSKPIIGNEIKKIVSWDGITDVSKLQGKTIRLHFYMKDADLYSLKFNK